MNEIKFCGLTGIFLLSLVFACSDGKPRSAGTGQPPLQISDTPLLSPQVNPLLPVDVSPMDIAYLPADYPIMKMSGNAPDLPIARVIYSRPHRQGRTIFGGLLKYGEPWRLGANEATEIEFFRPVTINNRRVDKGRYMLYCIPEQKKWTVVFNSNLYSWGLKPDRAKDLFEIEVPVTASTDTLEYFTMVFQKTAEGFDLVMAWEKTMARMPIQF